METQQYFPPELIFKIMQYVAYIASQSLNTLFKLKSDKLERTKPRAFLLTRKVLKAYIESEPIEIKYFKIYDRHSINGFIYYNYYASSHRDYKTRCNNAVRDFELGESVDLLVPDEKIV